MVNDPNLTLVNPVENAVNESLFAASEVGAVAEDVIEEMAIDGGDLAKPADPLNHVFEGITRGGRGKRHRF